MLLPLVTSAVALFYLSAVPIHIAFRLCAGRNGFFGVGVSAFEPRFALKRSRKKRRSSKRPAFHDISKPDALKSGLSSLKFILRHIKIELIRLDGSLGTHDAALTALICGGASAVGCILGDRRKIQISLRPDFASGSFRAELCGMIRLRAGHIMLAALLGAFQYGSRRIQKWTSIPSKAS